MRLGIEVSCKEEEEVEVSDDGVFGGPKVGFGLG
jgi:hypothetical protein